MLVRGVTGSAAGVGGVRPGRLISGASCLLVLRGGPKSFLGARINPIFARAQHLSYRVWATADLISAAHFEFFRSRRGSTVAEEGSTSMHEQSAADEIDEWARGMFAATPWRPRNRGEQCKLGVRTVQHLVVDIATLRFPFAEFIRQAAFMASASALPTMFVAIPIGVTLSIQFGLLAGQVGATSLAGAASGLAVIKQGAPMVAALLMASAAGSAVCADLGSRKIRDEIDALEVMGISVVRRLVVPRFAAAILVGLALTGLVCFVGFLSGYLFNTFVMNGTRVVSSRPSPRLPQSATSFSR